MFPILIVVTFSRMYKKLIKLSALNICDLLYINYTSIKLFNQICFVIKHKLSKVLRMPMACGFTKKSSPTLGT